MGSIDHQILGIHHVKPGPHEFAWDMGFLALGISLIMLGWFIIEIDNEDRQTTN